MATELPVSQQASHFTALFHQGIAFYQAGTKQIKTPWVNTVFSRMLEEKQRAASMLTPFYSDDVAVVEHALSLSDLYNNVLESLPLSSEKSYVSQLSEIEEKFIHSVDEVLNELSPGEFTTELRCIRNRMQQCLDELLSLLQ